MIARISSGSRSALPNSSKDLETGRPWSSWPSSSSSSPPPGAEPLPSSPGGGSTGAAAWASPASSRSLSLGEASAPSTRGSAGRASGSGGGTGTGASSFLSSDKAFRTARTRSPRAARVALLITGLLSVAVAGPRQRPRLGWDRSPAMGRQRSTRPRWRQRRSHGTGGGEWRGCLDRRQPLA